VALKKQKQKKVLFVLFLSWLLVIAHRHALALLCKQSDLFVEQNRSAGMHTVTDVSTSGARVLYFSTVRFFFLRSRSSQSLNFGRYCTAAHLSAYCTTKGYKTPAQSGQVQDVYHVSPVW